MSDRDIFLVGYRGSGKSTVGRLLAERLDCPFYDADLLFRERAGQEIAEFVELRGWDEFRRLESEILTRFVAAGRAEKQRILATGGGIVLAAENRAWLRRSGVVIWLQAGVKETQKRLLADPLSPAQRPPLSKLSPAREIVRDLAARAPLYRETAHYTIAVDGLDANVIVERIVAFLLQPSL